MVWEANPWREIQTDLYRLDNTTLTAIRYGDEILHSLQTPRWCTLTPGLMWTEFAGTSWRINEYHWLAPKLAWPKSNRAPHYVSVHLTPSGWTSDCPGSQWCLVQTWEEPPRTPQVVSLEAGPGVIGHTHDHVGAKQTTENRFELVTWHFSEINEPLFSLWSSACLWIQLLVSDLTCL